MKVEHVPNYWGAYNIGYHYRVGTDGIKCAALYNWLETQLGAMSKGAWIDYGSDICFKNESDAQMFLITWCTE